ncbi:unnamed protein product, partial [Laminaria digitata]
HAQARRWHHPDGPARRFLSHLLTFPLTLSMGLHEVGLSSSSPNRGADRGGGGGGGHRVSVVCVGARAESTLPPDFWRETLFALPGVSRLSLHLLGPELGVPPGVVASSATGGGNRRSSSPGGVGGGQGGGDSPPIPDHPTAVVSIGDRTAEIRWIRAVLDRSTGECAGIGKVGDKGLGAGMAAGSAEAAAEATTSAAAAAATAAATAAVAAVAAAERAIAGADAFVLFNPGLGHPHLREGWEGALKRLLTSGKPIIVSCHSRQDLDRDERQLRAIGDLCGFGGTAGGRGVDIFSRDNAFGSLMKSEDPMPSVAGAEEIVSSNWGLLIVGANR